MRLLRRRARRLTALALLGAGLAAAPQAAAQLSGSTFTVAGRSVVGLNLYGTAYVADSQLTPLLNVTQAGGIVQVQAKGHLLLLPLDPDSRRAATASGTVQLDTTRVQAPTATQLNGQLLLPLATLAQGLGADYDASSGTLSFKPLRLIGVSSLTGTGSDRVVFTLTRDAAYKEELIGGRLRLTLPGVTASTQTYSTRGAFVPRVQVNASGGSAQLELPIPPGSGYRVFRVVGQSGTGQSGTGQGGAGQGGTRLVVDAGPGISSNLPELLARVRKPLIVLDPTPLAGQRRDVTLEVARTAAELLSKAGWQVQLTRDAAGAAPVQDRAALARRSDVFVSLGLGRFPGAARSGVTLYQASGTPPTQVVTAYREASGAGDEALLRAAVGAVGESRQLSDLLRGELKTGGVTAAQQGLSRQLTLNAAPHAALLLELGWPQDGADATRLGSGDQNTRLAQALARAVATFLTARANSAGAGSASSGGNTSGGAGGSS